MTYHVHYTADGVLADETGEIVTCSWFATCVNDATRVLEHPVLGGVPICDVCLIGLGDD